MPKQRITRTRSNSTPAASPETVRRPRVCDACSGCQRAPCELCIYCRDMTHIPHIRKCLFRLCLHYKYTEQTKRRSALAAERSFQSLSCHENNDNNTSEAQLFLQQCQQILIKKHGISLEFNKWKQDSSWRVWHRSRQQWGIARRVSSDPPRYDIQLMNVSSSSSRLSSLVTSG